MEYLRLRCCKESLNKFICFEAELAKLRFISSCICYKPSASQVIRAWLKWFFCFFKLRSIGHVAQSIPGSISSLPWAEMGFSSQIPAHGWSGTRVENPLQWEEGEILQRLITQMFRMPLFLQGSNIPSLSQCISAVALRHRAQVSAPGFAPSLGTF